jgi:hypothetical protein
MSSLRGLSVVAATGIDSTMIREGVRAMHATTIDRAYRPRPWVTFRLFAPLLLALSVVLGGCTMSETEQRTASGAGIGAAVGAAGGALFGAFAGVPGTGAAIGAAAGAALGGGAGYIVDQQKKREDAEAESAKLRQQNQQMQQQQTQPQ